MILNAPSVIAAALAAFRVVLAVVVVVRAAQALRLLGRAGSGEEHDRAEVAALRPVVGAAALFVLAVVSWPLLVEVLRSYVPLWASVMCIDGVTRIGEGTIGPARHLPWLLDVLFVAKPVLLVLGGAWLVTHLVLRRAPGRPGAAGPWMLVALGLCAFVDGAAEIAYLVVPKREETLSAGCCLVTALLVSEPETSLLAAALGAVAPAAAYGLLGGSAVLFLGSMVHGARRPPAAAPHGGPWCALVPVAAAGMLVAAQHVLLAIASPRFTGVSAHRCGWCVVEQSPAGGASAGMVVAAAAAGVLAALAATVERRRGVPARTSRSAARLAVVLVALSAGLLLIAGA